MEVSSLRGFIAYAIHLKLLVTLSVESWKDVATLFAVRSEKCIRAFVLTTYVTRILEAEK